MASEEIEQGYLIKSKTGGGGSVVAVTSWKGLTRRSETGDEFIAHQSLQALGEIRFYSECMESL